VDVEITAGNHWGWFRKACNRELASYVEAWVPRTITPLSWARAATSGGGSTPSVSKTQAQSVSTATAMTLMLFRIVIQTSVGWAWDITQLSMSQAYPPVQVGWPGYLRQNLSVQGFSYLIKCEHRPASSCRLGVFVHFVFQFTHLGSHIADPFLELEDTV
jgi:hypothetical protein